MDPFLIDEDFVDDVGPPSQASKDMNRSTFQQALRPTGHQRCPNVLPCFQYPWSIKWSENKSWSNKWLKYFVLRLLRALNYCRMSR